MSHCIYNHDLYVNLFSITCSILKELENQLRLALPSYVPYVLFHGVLPPFDNVWMAYAQSPTVLNQPLISQPLCCFVG